MSIVMARIALARLGAFLHRSVAFGLLGALLLASVAVGEARAATITPSPDDDATPGDDLVRPVGGGACYGVYGVGKALMTNLSVDEWDEIELDTGSFAASFGSLEIDAGLSELGGPLVPEAGTSLVFLEAIGCLPIPGSPESVGFLDERSAYASFTPPMTISATFKSEGEVICEANLPMLWIGDPVVEVDPGSGEDTAWAAWLWTQDGTQTFEFPSGDDTRNDVEEAFNAAAELAFVTTLSEPAEVDCAAPAPVSQPVSPLALVCAPEVAAIGATVTCTVTGGDPDMTILWRASAASAFAGQGVTLDADGRGTFQFTVPASVGDGPVLVELVEWDRSATVVMSGTLVPTRVPAGEGRPLGAGLLALAVLSSAGFLVARPRGSFGR